MSFIKFSFLVIGILFCSNSFWSQSCNEYLNLRKVAATEQKLCADAMNNDLIQLHDAILEIHPNPFIYIKEEVFLTAYKKALLASATEKSVTEFAQIIAEFVHSIKDSHTNFNVRDLLFGGYSKKLITPFYLKQIDKKFYLEEILNDQLPVGVEVLKVNQFKADSLFKLSQSLSLIEADAFDAQSEISTKMMGIVFNVFNPQPFVSLTYVTEKGDTLTNLCERTTVKKMMRLKKWFDLEELNYFINENNVAVLTIKSFEPRNLNKFKKEIDYFFAQVKAKNCQQVVIDLRDNRGGLILAQEYVISHLNKENVPQKMNYLYRRSKFDRFSSLPFYQEWQFQKRARFANPNGILTKEFEFYKSPFGTVKTILYDYLPRNNENQVYSGKCTLVINGFSMSASAMFASWFRDNKRGEILGTPCMGSMSGTFGNSAVIRLEHSQLPIMISTLKFTPVKYSEMVFNSIQPDKWINAGIDDLKSKEDPVLKYLGIKKKIVSQ
ncbi:MAG: hypothetical protein EBQ94_13390 [Flavobacteriales bacterium]|nr:hypothetical protein [Crocinitomicaceae bacterium]NBX81341.1 hypothetical protein [Flavobacteriales bacterium]NCA20703.1 hypothetical protein [Crocinitomicaceae bacterium]